MSIYHTPLRYPGGKQKLTSFILEVLLANGLVNGHYAEPYAGGAGVAMELLLKGMVEHVHLNDSCIGVYSFWDSILKQPEEFCRRISSVSLTIEEWRKQKTILAQPQKHKRFDVGFSVFYLNRCNRSGILSGGVIGGLNQTGKWKIDARFMRNELIRRVEAIANKKKFISLKNLDAEKFLQEYVSKLPRKTLVYCDPPYFYKADRLYLNHYAPKDHERISRVIQNKIKHHWVVSYDGAPEILKHYSKRRKFLYDLQYNAAKAYKGREVFIFSDKLKLPLKSEIPSIDKELASLAL